MNFFEAIDEAGFRGDVEYFQFAFEEVSLLSEVYPDETMTLKGEAVRAEGIGPCVDPSIGEEGSEAGLANRTLNGTATIEYGGYFQSDTRHPLEIFPGYVANEEGDDFLHKTGRR